MNLSFDTEYVGAEFQNELFLVLPVAKAEVTSISLCY
jgi:hypothetical protein